MGGRRALVGGKRAPVGGKRAPVGGSLALAPHTLLLPLARDRLALEPCIPERSTAASPLEDDSRVQVHGSSEVLDGR